MVIVITGALGHIGSFLIRDLALHFSKSELKIIMIDNLITQRFSSLFNLPNNIKYEFVEADVAKSDLDKIFKNIDFVIHLAAITDAAGSFENAALVEENNFKATENVAKSCLHTKSKLIFLSSTSVYGTQNILVTEDCSINDLKPQSPYAVTKLKEENYLNNLIKNDGLDAIICRFGTIYGASIGMRFHTAVNKFCWQAVMNKPLTIWDTAYDQKRPYLDLKDASNAIAFIIKNNIFDGQVYNILSQNLTVRNVVDAIKKYKPNIELSFFKNKIMNQLSYEVSSKKFRSHKFHFSGDYEKSIQETIEQIKNSNS